MDEQYFLDNCLVMIELLNTRELGDQIDHRVFLSRYIDYYDKLKVFGQVLDLLEIFYKLCLFFMIITCKFHCGQLRVTYGSKTANFELEPQRLLYEDVPKSF